MMFRRSTIIEYTKTEQIDMKVETVDITVQANNQVEALETFKNVLSLNRT